MKKVILAILIAAGLVTGTPAALGWFLERDANARIDQLLEEASFLNVAEHSYHRGWFSSDETITLQLISGMPMPPMTASDGAKAPVRITVHNAIHHGPLPALSGIGLARIDTEFVRPAGPPATATPKPSLGALTIQTTLGLLGSATTVIRHSVIKEAPLAEGWSLSADAIDFTIRHGRHADTIDVEGKVPHVLARRDDGTRIELTGLQLASHSRRALRSIYTGGGEMTLGDFEFNVPPGEAGATRPAADAGAGGMGDAGAGAGLASLRVLRATFQTATEGAFLNSDFKLSANYAGAGGYHVQGLKVDAGIEHWQIDATERLVEGMRRIQRAHAAQPAAQVPEIQELWKTEGIRLAVNDPGIVLRDFEFATADGFAKLTGSVRLPGATEADFKPTVDFKALLSKLTAELDVSMDARLATKLAAGQPGGPADAKRPPGPPPLQALETQGFVVHDGDRLRSRLVFTDGRLTVNGKPFPGAPPPGSPHAN
jgi:uncharacterized protein YdgA (DUF945 family)